MTRLQRAREVTWLTIRESTPRQGTSAKRAMTKSCSVCRSFKDIEDFPVDRSRKDGRLCRCRDCDNERSRRYYEQNRTAVLARVNAYNVVRRERATIAPES